MEHFAFLDHLPKHGALPIPWTTPIDKATGRPNFRITDRSKHNMSCRFQLCGVCGKYIAQAPYAMLVAPLCLAERLVFGTPMHPDCSLAALTMCPHLAYQKWQRHADSGVAIVPDEEPLPKPQRVGIALLEKVLTHEGPAKMLYVRLPAEPAVQWFSYVEGQLMPEPETTS